MKKLLALSLAVLLLSPLIANASEKSFNWYFKPNKTNTKPEIIPEAKEIIGKYNTIYFGESDEKKLYLTFDAGYDNGYHEKILDTLKEKNVSAAFFVDGNFLKRNEAVAKRIVAEGHLLCNHSKTHPDTSVLSEEEFTAQIKGWEEIYRQTVGSEPPKLFRPPMGKFSENSLSFAEKLGYTTVFWSFAYKDWENDNQPKSDYALKNLKERTHPGAVLLLHSTSKTNSEILGAAIDMLINDGYSFHLLTEIA